MTIGKTVDNPRWKKCIAFVNDYMGLAVGRLFIKDNFAPDAKAGVST